MALSKEKKAAVVQEISDLLSDSKLTVIAQYKGISVKSMQELRKQAKSNGTTVRVVKNRLVKQAMAGVGKLSKTDSSILKEQLIYAFNSEDEVAPAQALNAFSKKETNLQFVGAFASDGTFMSIDDVKVLANLPSKDQLRAQLVGTIAAPLSGFANVLSGNIRGVLNVLTARAENI